MRVSRADDADAGRPVVFAPTGVRVLAGVVWLALAAYVVLLVRQGTTEEAVRFAPVAGLVALTVYATFWRPSVAVDDERVVVRNVLRDVTVPFARLDALDTKYALRLECGDRTVSAWAAPAPGRLSSMSLNRREASASALLGADLDQGLTASAAPNTDSGGAALMVRVRWLRWIERRNTTGGVPDGDAPVTAVWVLPLVVGLGGLLVLSVLAVVV